MSEKNTATIDLDKYVELQKIEEAYLRNQVVIYDYYSRGRVYATANRDEKLADLAEKLREFDQKYETLIGKEDKLHDTIDDLSKENRHLKEELDNREKAVDKAEEKKPNAWQRFIKKYIA